MMLKFKIGLEKLNDMDLHMLMMLKFHRGGVDCNSKAVRLSVL